MPTSLLENVIGKSSKLRLIRAKQEAVQQRKDLERKISNTQGGDTVAYANGRMFDVSMTSGRSNGYSNNDLIENPVYIIESLIRHEVLAEKDLICEDLPVYSGYSAFSFNDNTGYLLSDLDDYYNGAYLINLTKDWTAPILDYIGTTRTILVASTYIGTESDHYKVFNIKADVIDTTTFDNIGNTTNGVKKNWKFAKSINVKSTWSEIAKSITRESFIGIVKSGSKYKLHAISENKTTVDGTLSMPIILSGLPSISIQFTPVENLYTEFEFNYGYEYGRNEYQNKILVTNTFATTLSVGDFDDEQLKTKDCITNYGINNKKLSIDLEWIYDTDTAVLYAKKMIDICTRQRAVISYIGDYQHHLQYEEGDVVKIDYPKVMPASLNNSTQFQIQSVNIDMSKNRIITFTLLEI